MSNRKPMQIRDVEAMHALDSTKTHRNMVKAEDQKFYDQAQASRSFLLITHLLSPSENERVHKRIKKWLDSQGLTHPAYHKSDWIRTGV